MGEKKSLWEVLGYAAMLSAVIAGLIRIFVSISGEDMDRYVIRYGLMGIFSSFPALVTLIRLREFAGVPAKRRKTNKKIKTDIEPGEYIIVDTRPHPVYFIKLYLSSSLAMALAAYLIAFSVNISASVSENAGLFFLVSMVLASTVHILSINALKANRYLHSLEKAWSILFSVLWSAFLISNIKSIFDRTYPVEFWEKFLGIPSLALVLLAIILFITSSILWRLDAYLSKRERGPLGAASIVMMCGGIAVLFPPVWALFSSGTLREMLWLFLFVDVVLTLSIAGFATHRGGIRFMVTTKRIVYIQDFLMRYVREYPYSSIVSVKVVQGVIGRIYGYGDLRFEVNAGRRRLAFTMHGIKNPELVKNTVLSMCDNPAYVARKRDAEKRLISTHLHPLYG